MIDLKVNGLVLKPEDTLPKIDSLQENVSKRVNGRDAQTLKGEGLELYLFSIITHAADF